MRNNVRAANAADFDFVKNCWTECFDDDERYVNWNFSENYSAANTLVAECCGEPAAAMQCIPSRLKKPIYRRDISRACRQCRVFATAVLRATFLNMPCLLCGGKERRLRF